MNDLGFLLFGILLLLWWIAVEVGRIRRHFVPTPQRPPVPTNWRAVGKGIAVSMMVVGALMLALALGGCTNALADEPPPPQLTPADIAKLEALLQQATVLQRSLAVELEKMREAQQPQQQRDLHCIVIDRDIINCD